MSAKAEVAIGQLIHDTDGALVLTKREGNLVHFSSRVDNYQVASKTVFKAIQQRGLGTYLLEE